MAEISTGLLTDVLLELKPDEMRGFEKQYLADLQNLDFHSYYLALLEEKGIRRSTAIANSGLEIHYAYQILNGRKRPGRDKILCLCIGGGFSLQETDRALQRAEAGSLYPKRLRDAVVMLALNQQIHTVWRVNELLAEYGEELLN